MPWGQSLDIEKIVRDIARKKGCTVAALFRYADVAYSNWGRWRAGETTPSFRTLDRLENADVPTKRKAGR